MTGEKTQEVRGGTAILPDKATRQAELPKAVTLESYLVAANAYRAAGRYHDAGRVLTDATVRFPDQPKVFIEWGMTAQQAMDWREADRRWQVLRKQFPDEPQGYDSGGHALRHLNRCDEADAIAEEGLARLPGNVDILISHAWTATVRNDWAQAESRWRRVLATQPLTAAAFVGLAEALKEQTREAEAESLLLEATELCPDNPAIAETFAKYATQRRDWETAAQRWSEARSRFPGSGVCHHQLGAALKQMGQLDAAERVLDEGTKLVPDYLPLAIEHAWFANVRSDWPEALRRWEAIAARFPVNMAIEEGLMNVAIGAVPPANPDRHGCYIESLIKFGRVDEAEVELERARNLYPNQPKLLIIAVTLAAKRESWEDAVKILDAYETLYPDHPVSRELLPASAYAELSRVAAEKRFRQPGDSLFLWKQILKRFSDNPGWLNGHIDTLILLGRLDEAGAELESARRLYPDHRGLLLNSGVLASKREDWDSAIATLEAYLATYPDDSLGREFLARVKMERGFAQPQDQKPEALIARPQDVGFEKDDAIRALLLGFESIGEDCEFGLVQRHYGAEPIGLFRWNTTSAQSLMDSLAAQLSGFGEPENTILSIWDEYEYYLSDKRWGFGFHTWLSKYEVDGDVLYPKMCRRLVYLRDKFISDLQAAEKVYVFKTSRTGLTELRALHASLRAHGPVRLLCVMPVDIAVSITPVEADARHVYKIADDLYLGLISRFGNRPGQWDIVFDDWVAICKNIGQAEMLSKVVTAQ